MPFILSVLTVVFGLFIIQVSVNLPFALLRWIHLPTWFGWAIALLLFSWLLGNRD